MIRCRKGDLCLVVGEIPGCEENIGATLVVTELVIDAEDGPVWEFAEASRPLKILDEAGSVAYVAASSDHPDSADNYIYVLDMYLVPLRREPPRESVDIQEQIAMGRTLAEK